jgi:hypothetical protein
MYLADGEAAEALTQIITTPTVGRILAEEREPIRYRIDRAFGNSRPPVSRKT